jgi:hypothetical protein
LEIARGQTQVNLEERTTEQVIEDHLGCRMNGDIEGDIERNYSPDMVVMTSRGLFHGKDEIRNLNRMLHKAIDSNNYIFPVKLFDGPYAFIEWRVRAPGKSIEDGADSFVVRDGKIVFQSIHYMIEETMPV